jgi:hypothetical protein
MIQGGGERRRSQFFDESIPLRLMPERMRGNLFKPHVNAPL